MAKDNTRTLTDADVEAIAKAVTRRELRVFKILLSCVRPKMARYIIDTLNRYTDKELEVAGGDEDDFDDRAKEALLEDIRDEMRLTR